MYTFEKKKEEEEIYHFKKTSISNVLFLKKKTNIVSFFHIFKGANCHRLSPCNSLLQPELS